MKTLKVNPWAPPLVLAAVAVALWVTPGIENTFSLIISIATLVFALVALIHSASHGLRPVSAAFYAFWFAWLGIGPVVQLTIGRVAWRDTTILPNAGDVNAALFLTLTALLAFWGGEQLGRRRPRRGVREPATATVRGWVLGLLVGLFLGVAPLAIRVTGLATYFTSRSERADALGSGGTTYEDLGGALYAVYTILPVTLSVSILLISLHHLRSTWAGFGRVRLGYALATLVGLVGVCIFANPLSQSRFIALTAFGSALLLLLRSRSTRAGFTYVGILIFAGVLIYPLANSFRYEGGDLIALTETTFASADFDGFQQVVNTMRFVEGHGITWGIQAISAVLFFVPRSIWPGKAEPAGGDIAEFAGYTFTNLSLPIHAELYLQGGFPVMAIGMGAMGYIASRLDHAWLYHPGSKLAVIAPFMAVATFGILRGPLGGGVPVWLPILALLAVAIRGRNASDTGITGAPRFAGNGLAR